MDYILISLEDDALEAAAEGVVEKALVGSSLEEAHNRVRKMWPFPNVDTSEKSRLAWRKGDTVVTYTYAVRDVLMIVPSVLV